MKQYVPQQLRIISSIDVLIGEYILALFNALKSCFIPKYMRSFGNPTAIFYKIYYFLSEV